MFTKAEGHVLQLYIGDSGVREREKASGFQ